MAARNKGLPETLALVLTAFLAGKFERAAAVEVCTGEVFDASCEPDEVLMMTSAEYGRKEVGRCITETDDFMGCTNDVLPLLDRWCSGRRECTVNVPNPDIEASNTACLKILKMYMEVMFTCFKVINQCISTAPNPISANHGILSSHVTSQKGCGSQRSPWVISAKVGQTINMTMLDFSVSEQTDNNLIKCRHVYGYILERALGINHTICGGKQREGALYSSKTNSVEVYISHTAQDIHFLINYQAVGCPDMDPPDHAWYKREGSEAVIGCETNDQEWRLTCTGNTWRGVVGNCSVGFESVLSMAAPVDKEEHYLDVEMPSAVFLAAIAGGAVVVIVVVIVIGVVYLKKYRLRQETRQMQKTYATVDRTTLAYYRPVTADPATNQQPPPSWDAPLTDKEAGTLTSYPGQCSCATLQSRDSRNTSAGGSLGKQHVYNSIDA